MVFYEKQNFTFFLISFIFVLLLTVGLTIYTGITEGWILAVVVLVGLGFIGMLMGICAWISYRRRIVVHEDGITFYYKLFSSTKKYNGYNRKGLHIRYDEIKSFSQSFHPGIFLLTRDCHEYSLRLSDGATIQLWMHGMAKKDEDFVVNLLRKRIK